MKALGKLLWADARKHTVRLIVLSLGLALATALFIALVALGAGVRQSILAQLSQTLPGQLVSVKAKHVQVGPLDLALGGLLGDAPLDFERAEQLGHLPQVTASYPVLDVSLPMTADGGGALIGRSLHAEIFMSALAEPLGVPQAGEPALLAPFVDNPKGPIPVLISPTLVALYNTTVAPALGTPQLVPEALLGFTFTIQVGRSHLVPSVTGQRQGTLRAQVVGLSTLALPLGISVPLATGQRLMATYAPEQDGESVGVLREVLLATPDATALPALTAAIDAMGLQIDPGAARLKDILAAMVMTLAMVGALVLALAGLGILHAFAAYVHAREREVALIRAVGATPGFVFAWMLATAAWVGLSAGGLGSLMAWGAITVLNQVLTVALAQVPLMPKAPFLLDGTLIGAGVALSVATALLGAVGPASRAALANNTQYTHMP